MIVVAARPTHSGYAYTVAKAGDKPITTDYTWEAVEAMLELGVENPDPLLAEAENLGAAFISETLTRSPVVESVQARAA